MRKPKWLLFASAVATSVVVLPTTAAFAATPMAVGGPHGTVLEGAVTPSCAADVVVGITSSHYYLIWDGVTWFHDGPGGTVTGQVQRQTQVSATLSYGADITLNDLVAS